jgi:hypothetical protein
MERNSLPDFGLLTHKFLHKIDTFVIVEHDDLNSSLLQIRLSTEPALVLANDDTRDAK